MGTAANPSGQTPAAALRMRRAELSDAAAVRDLLGELGYPCDLGEAQDRILHIHSSHRQSLIVAELAHTVVGMVCLDFMYYLPIGRETCRVTALVINSAHRNQQFGHALLRFAEAVARREGAARIELTTAAQRADAHRFYKASGYADNSLRFVKNLSDA